MSEKVSTEAENAVEHKDSLTIMHVDSSDQRVKEYFSEVGKELGIDIALVEPPKNPDSRQAYISTLLSSGDSEVDIFTVNDEMISEFKYEGYITGMDKDIISYEDDFPYPEKYFSSMIMKDSKIYSIPYKMDVLCLWINESWLNDAGIENIDTEENMNRFLTYKWGNDRYAYGGAWEKTYAFNEVGEFINLFGGNYYDWSDPQTRKAVEFMKSLITGGVSSLGQILDQYEQMNQKFIDGKYGIVFMFSGGMNTYLSAGAYGKNKIQMLQIPSFWNKKTYVATWQYALNNASEHKESALKFLKYAAGKEGSVKYAVMTNTLPARMDIIEQMDLDITGYQEMKAFLKDTELIARPMLKDSMVYIENFGTLFQKYIVDEISLDEYCTRVQKLIDDERNAEKTD